MYQGLTISTGATTLFPWEDRGGQPVRPFRGTSCAIGQAIEVYVEGQQSMSGLVRTIVVNDVEVTPEQLRELVVACGDVLAEVEQ